MNITKVTQQYAMEEDDIPNVGDKITMRDCLDKTKFVTFMITNKYIVVEAIELEEEELEEEQDFSCGRNLEKELIKLVNNLRFQFFKLYIYYNERK